MEGEGGSLSVSQVQTNSTSETNRTHDSRWSRSLEIIQQEEVGVQMRFLLDGGDGFQWIFWLRSG